MTHKELQALREQRKATKAKIDETVDLAARESRDFNDAEKADLKTRKEDLEVLDGKIDEALAAIEKERSAQAEKEKREAEIRREERLKELDKEMEIAQRRRTSFNGAGGDGPVEIRVADNFPMLGRECRSFTSVYGGEQRGRQEAYKAGMWFLGEVIGNEECRRWNREYGYGAEKRVLNNVVPAQGSVLVPEGLMNTIIWNVEDRGVFARYANIVPMGQNDTLTVAKSTGEVTVYAVAENMTSEVADSTPTMGGVELTARTWAALVLVGRNLLDDAVINIGEYIARKIGYGVADKQDLAGFTGDGTSTYHNIYGLVNKIGDGTHTASVVDAISGNTGFATLDMADFETVVGKLPQTFENEDAAWYISKVGYYASMAALMDAAGGNTQDNVAGGKQLQFLGYPVRISQVMNRTLGAQASTIVALFGSLRSTSMYAQKKELSIQTLIEKYATLNQIGLLGFTRFGINNHELGDNTTAGAMIALKTASS